MNDNINLLVCGNAGVYDGITLLSLSLAEYTERPITLYIGTMDFTDRNERFTPITKGMSRAVEKILREKNPKSRAVLLDFGERFREELGESKNLDSGYTPYAMIRLFADEIKPSSGKLLYLDTDIMLNGDIAELYDLDIAEYHLAGVRDYIGRWFFGPRYLNSGVLLLNLEELKEDEVLKKARSLCKKKRMLLFDQHAINKFARRKLILKRRYNEQKRTREATLIRHFSKTVKLFPIFHTENIKPWQISLVHERLSDHSFDNIYIKYNNLKKKESERKII